MNSSTLTSKLWLLLYFVVLLCSVGVGWIYTKHFEPETRFWVDAFRERRGEIRESRDGRRVIFSGDSACSFGINPQLFQKETGLKTYNLGGTRQMGMEVFMSEALKHARENDMLVLICNPALLATEADQESLPKAGGRMELALSNEVTAGEFVDATRPGFNHLVSLGAKVALRKPMFRYSAEDRRPLGQVVTSLRDHPRASLREFEMEERLPKMVSVLDSWQKRCAQQGVSLYFLLPVELTDASILEENRQKKGELLDELEKQLPQVKVLRTELLACSDDDSLFADTLFHLTEEAAADLTRRLVPLVEEAMKEE